jgi:hypothetical protein
VATCTMSEGIRKSCAAAPERAKEPEGAPVLELGVAAVGPVGAAPAEPKPSGAAINAAADSTARDVSRMRRVLPFAVSRGGADESATSSRHVRG